MAGWEGATSSTAGLSRLHSLFIQLQEEFTCPVANPLGGVVPASPSPPLRRGIGGRLEVAGGQKPQVGFRSPERWRLSSLPPFS